MIELLSITKTIAESIESFMQGHLTMYEILDPILDFVYNR